MKPAIIAFLILCLLGISVAVSSEDSEKYISIKEDGTIYHSLKYQEPDPGKDFLIMNIDFKDYGYDGFEVNPYRCKVTVDSVEYGPIFADLSLKDMGMGPLDSVKLNDGGKISGYVAFQIPSGSTQYSFKYETYSWENYNIKFEK